MVGIAIRNPDDGAKTRLRRAFGREERVGDLRFADNPSRAPDRDGRIGVVTTTAAEHGAAPLMASLAGRGAPFSRVSDHENQAAEGRLDALGVIESGDGTACSAFRPADAPRTGQRAREVPVQPGCNRPRIGERFEPDTARKGRPRRVPLRPRRLIDRPAWSMMIASFHPNDGAVDEDRQQSLDVTPGRVRTAGGEGE